MINTGPIISEYDLGEQLGIRNTGTVYWNLTTPMLYEEALKHREAEIIHLGPMAARTGKHTGRSPNDRYIVKEETTEKDIWWGDVNRPISEEKFDFLLEKVLVYFQSRDLFVFDGYAGADKRYRMPVRVITEYAWHSLFARNMFIQEKDPELLRTFRPGFTVIDVPRFFGHPDKDGLNSPTFILLNFKKRMVLIGGTEYAGEIKKSIFSALNYFLPGQGVLSMHCSANYGEGRDDAAIFFGLSGTGKTTLSNDVTRTLVGDDEHGWSDNGVFNFEGGCYAKVIRLDPKGEPEIYKTTRMFGTILENVMVDMKTKRVDLNDATLTENTRASYPLTHIDNVDRSGLCGHPKNIIFLTADAFGVLPPISRLTKEQAMYHFLSGYTAKVAGTERGVTEPKATFSVCFGGPFMPRHPGEYAKLLGEKIDQHQAKVWLVNTGWTGGGYGVGQRMSLAYTRAMVNEVLEGRLNNAEFVTEPFFGLAIPKHVPGVPDHVLNPRNTWTDTDGYDHMARRLVDMFVNNFKKFEAGVAPEITAAGPKL